MAVVPGTNGLGVVSYSPKIDGAGNSARGIAFFEALARRLPGVSVFR